METETKELEPKQDQFCREYIIDFNATKAAIRAGYSEKTAREQAYRLLTKAHIRERVAALKKELNDSDMLEASDVMRMLLEDHEAAKELKQMGPAVRSIELIGKRFAMFTDKYQTTPTEIRAQALSSCGMPRSVQPPSANCGIRALM